MSTINLRREFISTLTLSPRARAIADNPAYGDTHFDDFFAVQRVHIQDYLEARDGGNAERAEKILETINVYGEILDALDGTARP